MNIYDKIFKKKEIGSHELVTRVNEVVNYISEKKNYSLNSDEVKLLAKMLYVSPTRNSDYLMMKSFFYLKFYDSKMSPY